MKHNRMLLWGGVVVERLSETVNNGIVSEHLAEAKFREGVKSTGIGIQ